MAKEDKKTILQELDSKNRLVVDDNVVKESNLCIILSCPGEEELISGRVCAGDINKVYFRAYNGAEAKKTGYN